jgi:C1A family cysteine protease
MSKLLYTYLLLNTITKAISLTKMEETFEEWHKKYGKNYSNALEHRYRLSVFASNYAEIEYRNSLNRTFTLGLNRFADLTNDEFRSKHLSSTMKREYSNDNTEYIKLNVDVIPSEVDWTQKGAVTPVKNQGQCGSCWAFSSTGAIEGAWFIATGQLVSLSEQELVDCSTAEGNQGCNGGLMDQAFKYVILNDGICSESAYPYTGMQNNCMSTTIQKMVGSYNPKQAIGPTGNDDSGNDDIPVITLRENMINCTKIAKIKSYVDIQPNNDTALMIAVAQQPVSVAVEADGLDWQFYMGGVVTDSCGTNLDHGVLVVGYGTDYTSQPLSYWKVKNSWGESWGENGYIRLGRGSKFDPNGECGILMQPSYPVV